MFASQGRPGAGAGAREPYAKDATGEHRINYMLLCTKVKCVAARKSDYRLPVFLLL